MIRVLHVMNWFRRGGVETQLLRILRDYDRSRFHVDACCIGTEEGYLADEARSYGAEIFMCRKTANFYSFSRRFERLLGGRDYDIVHAHADTWAGPLLRGALRAGVPVRIAHMRNSEPCGPDTASWPARMARSLAWSFSRRWIDRYGSAVMGVSAASLDVRWPGWRSHPSRFVVWTGGVEVDGFGPGSRKGAPVATAINVGSLRRCKNHTMLLGIFEMARREMGDAMLCLAGAGPEEPAIRRSVAERGLEGKVKFLGLRDDVPELLRESDIFLSCSRVEGLPNVLLEAQAAGLPVVASDIPPHREALSPEHHDFLFPLDDPGAARDAVLRVLRDDGLRRRLGEAGRRFVAERFDSGVALRRLQEMYVQWVEGTRAASRPRGIRP